MNQNVEAEGNYIHPGTCISIFTWKTYFLSDILWNIGRDIEISINQVGAATVSVTSDGYFDSRCYFPGRKKFGGTEAVKNN